MDPMMVSACCGYFPISEQETVHPHDDSPLEFSYCLVTRDKSALGIFSDGAVVMYVAARGSLTGIRGGNSRRLLGLSLTSLFILVI